MVSHPQKINATFFFLTITVFIGLLIPVLVQDGMFLDGVTYSAVAKNMANGYGSFGDPHYTKMLYPHFREHPPLVFILQSFFFNVFGSAFYTERIFSLLMALLTATGIILCRRLLSDSGGLKEYSWLPVLLWLLVPVVSWSYKNNMLENTMGVFTIYAVFFILKALIDNRLLWYMPAGILIFAAFLSKGFAGIFPLVVPVIFGIIYKSPKKTIIHSLALVLITGIFSLMLFWVFPELSENIAGYFSQQLLPALNNEREVTTHNRFGIILNLIFDLTLPLLIVLYFGFLRWRKIRTKVFSFDKPVLLYLLIALAASVPLIISLKQRKFYLIPSIPFYALAFSYFIVNDLRVITERISNAALTWLNRIVLLVLASVLIYSSFCYGKFSRDKEKLSDVYTISDYIPEGSIVSIPKELYSDWSLVAYMSRVGYLSLDCDNQHEYFLVEKNQGFVPPGNYKKLDLRLNKYEILRRDTTLSK